MSKNYSLSPHPSRLSSCPSTVDSSHLLLGLNSHISSNLGEDLSLLDVNLGGRQELQLSNCVSIYQEHYWHTQSGCCLLFSVLPPPPPAGSVGHCLRSQFSSHSYLLSVLSTPCTGLSFWTGPPPRSFLSVSLLNQHQIKLFMLGIMRRLFPQPAMERRASHFLLAVSVIYFCLFIR